MAWLTLLQSFAANAQDRPSGRLDPNEPMQFYSAGNGGNCSYCGWVAAVGVITQDTPDQFREFIVNDRAWMSRNLELNSPGVNLSAGLELGRLIREYGFSTSVSDTSFGVSGGVWDERIDGGACDSACAYAFLGGVDRSAEPESLGFHQFSWDAADREESIESQEGLNYSLEQLQQGIVVAYLVEMGIDARLILIASTAGPDEIVFLPESDLLELNVITSPFDESPWEIQMYGRGIVATLSRTYRDGHANVLNLFCVENRSRAPFLSIIHRYPFEVNNEIRYTDYIIGDVSVLINGQSFFVESYDNIDESELVVSYNDGHEISLLVQLPPSVLSYLEHAEGIALDTRLVGFVSRTLGQYDFDNLAPAGVDNTGRRAIALALRNCI